MRQAHLKWQTFRLHVSLLQGEFNLILITNISLMACRKQLCKHNITAFNWIIAVRWKFQ